MKRILIVKFWALGDILMATPLLRALKRQWPECHIAWLVDSRYADILRGSPLIDEVIAFDSGTWRRHFRYGQLVSYWQMSQKTRRELRARRLDIVINLTAEKWWAVWFNLAPVRIGLFPRPHPGWMGRLYTQAIPRRPGEHNSVHYLHPATALGIEAPFDQRLSLGVTPAAAAAANEFLGRHWAAQPHFDPAKPLIVLHPGTSQASKCWLPEHFAAVASALSEKYTVVLTGSPQEKPLAEHILSLMPEAQRRRVVVAAGALPGLLETIALVSRADAVVTGDTSILHIASALGIPLVGLYGSTRPGDNAPLFGPQTLLFDDTVPCAPCYKDRCPLHGAAHLRCQRSITPAQVLAALETLLKNVERKDVEQKDTSHANSLPV